LNEQVVEQYVGWMDGWMDVNIYNVVLTAYTVTSARPLATVNWGFSLLQNAVSVGVESRSNGGRLFQSREAHEAKLRKGDSSRCQNLQIFPCSRAQVTSTETSSYWHTQLFKVLRGGMMKTDQVVQFVHNSLRHWQPVAIVSECRRYVDSMLCLHPYSITAVCPQFNSRNITVKLSSLPR